jgi:hypothetical protein
MKSLIILLSIFILSSWIAPAPTGLIEIHSKSADYIRGLVYYKNSNYSAGQRVLIVFHGIGERGNETEVDLRRMAGWGGWGNLRNLADKYQFNIIWAQSNEDNSTNEIDYSLSRGIADLKADTNKIHMLGYSWGARRLDLWESLTTPYSHLPKTIMRISQGSINVDDVSNIIKRRRPTWLLHAIDDIKTSYQNSLATFVGAKKIDSTAPVYYTEYIARLDTIFGGHNMLKMLGDWQIAPPYKTKAGPGYTNNSRLSLVQWWEMNEWKSPTPPEAMHQVKPAEGPKPHADTLVVPEKKIIQTIILYSDSTYKFAS